jgi:hypothetical protein
VPFSIHVKIYGPLQVRDALITEMMRTAIALDEIEFLADPTIPSVIDAWRSGQVRYLTTACTEDSCIDVPWEDPKTVLARGWTDCKSIVAWRVAELRIRKKIRAEAVISRVTLATGDVVYHPVVKGWYGGRMRTEDPSEVLGMGKEGSILWAQ